MIRTVLHRGLGALAAGALLLAVAGPAAGQRHGYRGGYHGGSHGSYRSGYHGSHYAYYGGYHSGYRPYSGYRYGYRPYYHYRSWYGGSPYYAAWAYPYYYGWNSPYYTPVPVTYPYGTAYDLPALAALASGLGTAPATTTAAAVAPAPSPADTARITVRLPAAAELWVNGARMAQTGPVRVLDTPPLAAGQRYTYTVRARWTEDGRSVDQTQTVGFAPGDRIDVTFPTPAGP